MGVKGLNVFVKSICPTIFREIPTRFHGIQGKKIVIDGTLVTQRYYYARRSDPFRHIYGWFRLARDLEKAGVSAICVFDGKERSVAKSREVKRRKDARNLVGARYSFENARLQRLKKLKEGVQVFQSLRAEDRQRVFKALNEPSFTETKTSTLLQQELMNDQPVAPDEVPAASSKHQTTSESPSSISVEEIIPLFKSLSVSYRAGLAKLVALLANIEDGKTPILPLPNESEQLMTKRQSELAVHEGNLWKDISKCLDSPTSKMDLGVEENLNTLVQQSHDMAESFDRRRNAPTGQIYQESQEILRAMGIPCIQTTGGVEAEALASSLVLAGHADYVASEDTDVMVYGATLLKNITSYEVPLVTVSGSEMQTSLGLTHEQFLDFALLLGTDFTDRIVQIGPTRAYRFIKDHGNIETIVKQIENDPKHKPTVSWEAYFAQVEVARLVFNTLPPIPPPKTFQPIPKNDVLATEILKKHGLPLSMMNADDWDFDEAYTQSIAGNYFDDSPSSI